MHGISPCSKAKSTINGHSHSLYVTNYQRVIMPLWPMMKYNRTLVAAWLWRLQGSMESTLFFVETTCVSQSFWDWIMHMDQSMTFLMMYLQWLVTSEPMVQEWLRMVEECSSEDRFTKAPSQQAEKQHRETSKIQVCEATAKWEPKSFDPTQPKVIYIYIYIYI